jgi:hypothetical protein
MSAVANRGAIVLTAAASAIASAGLAATHFGVEVQPGIELAALSWLGVGLLVFALFLVAPRGRPEIRYALLALTLWLLVVFGPGYVLVAIAILAPSDNWWWPLILGAAAAVAIGAPALRARAAAGGETVGVGSLLGVFVVSLAVTAYLARHVVARFDPFRACNFDDPRVYPIVADCGVVGWLGALALGTTVCLCLLTLSMALAASLRPKLQRQEGFSA